MVYNMFNLINDEKGSIFSIELVFIVIIFTLAIGIIANLTDSTNEKIANSLESNNLEKISKALDNLINNPGYPNDWEKFDNYNNIQTGFAIINSDNKTIKNTISYEKITKLESNYDTLISKNIFNNRIKSSISIYPLNSDLPPLIYGNSPESGDIYAISHLVKCDYFSNFTIIDFNKIATVCNQNHESIYKCSYFRIYNSYLENMDYYLLYDKNSLNDVYYSIDDTHQENNDFNKLTNEKTHLNDILKNKLKNNHSGIFFIHFKDDSPNALLIAIPKNFDEKFINYNYFIENDCKIILRTWY